MWAQLQNTSTTVCAFFQLTFGLTDTIVILTDAIAVALTHLRLDYANSLLYGISATNIHKLQRCQNMATRLILQQPGTPSVQYLMDRLH